MAELIATFTCTNCQDVITDIRVHCYECTDFELCLPCFAAGAEIGSHRNDHKYQFKKDSVNVKNRSKRGWSSKEELLLLSAIEKYSFGNWEDTSEHIKTRSPEEAKEEYINKFINGPIGRHTLPGIDQRPRLNDEHLHEDTGPLGQLQQQNLPPIDVTPEEASQLGYMPNRDVFEREYDATAEELITSLSLPTVTHDDDDIDVVLKLAHVDIYTRRLRERARRKRLVRDYQLICAFFKRDQKPRQSKDYREFRDRFRVFAQFYTSMEFERRLDSFEREKMLRLRLSELCRYRWNGLQQFDECVHFEQHAAVAQNRYTGPYGQHGKTDQQRTGERHPLYSHYQPKRVGDGESEKPTNLNFIDQKIMHPIGDRVYLDGSLPNRNYLDAALSGTITTGNHNDRMVADSNGGSATGTLGEHLLSANEIKLCHSLNLPPTRYITLKTVLLSGDNIGGQQFIGLDSSIKKFFIKSGWLR